jgi:hypothetical protein
MALHAGMCAAAPVVAVAGARSSCLYHMLDQSAMYGTRRQALHQHAHQELHASTRLAFWDVYTDNQPNSAHVQTLGQQQQQQKHQASGINSSRPTAQTRIKCSNTTNSTSSPLNQGQLLGL